MNLPPTSDSLFPETMYGKLYTESAILLGTFLGGPLAGGYLLAQNFKAIDQPRKATIIWLATGGVLVLTLCVSFIPVLDNLPTLVYSFIFCLLAHTVARKSQGTEINMHRSQGGSFYSSGRAALVGVIALLVMAAVIVIIFYLTTLSSTE